VEMPPHFLRAFPLTEIGVVRLKIRSGFADVVDEGSWLVGKQTRVRMQMRFRRRGKDGRKGAETKTRILTEPDELQELWSW